MLKLAKRAPYMTLARRSFIRACYPKPAFALHRDYALKNIQSLKFLSTKAKFDDLNEEVEILEEDDDIEIEDYSSGMDFYSEANPEFNLKYQFNEYFDMSEVPSIHDVREGGYIALSDEDVKKYLPEGLPEGMVKEFEFSECNGVMIREADKLLCKIIDAHHLKYSPNYNPFKPENYDSGYTNTLTLSGFTDRPEWSNSLLQTFYYGKDLSVPTKWVKSPLTPVKGPEARYEKVYKNIRTEVESNALEPNKILLSGPRGTGKSFSLAQAVIHARKRGWIALYIPNGYDHVQGGSYIEPVVDAPTLLSVNEQVENDSSYTNEADLRPDIAYAENIIFDNVYMSVEALRNLWHAHANDLSKLPIKFTSNLNKYEGYMNEFKIQWFRARSLRGRDQLTFMQTRSAIFEDDSFEDEDEKDTTILLDFDFESFELKTLKDLLVLGVAFHDLAGLVFMDLVQELKNVTSVPILFAVDHYNTWDVNSVYKYDKKAVKGRQLCVPHSLTFLTNKKEYNQKEFKVANGLCIAATTFKYSEGNKIDYLPYKSSIPLLLRIPSYSQDEYLGAIAYYTDQGVIPRTFTMNELQGYRTYSQSNPFRMRSDSFSYFGRRSLEKLPNHEHVVDDIFDDHIEMDEYDEMMQSDDLLDGEAVVEDMEEMEETEEMEEFEDAEEGADIDMETALDGPMHSRYTEIFRAYQNSTYHDNNTNIIDNEEDEPYIEGSDEYELDKILKNHNLSITDDELNEDFDYEKMYGPSEFFDSYIKSNETKRSNLNPNEQEEKRIFMLKFLNMISDEKVSIEDVATEYLKNELAVREVRELLFGTKVTANFDPLIDLPNIREVLLPFDTTIHKSLQDERYVHVTADPNASGQTPSDLNGSKIINSVEELNDLLGITDSKSINSVVKDMDLEMIHDDAKMIMNQMAPESDMTEEQIEQLNAELGIIDVGTSTLAPKNTYEGSIQRLISNELTPEEEEELFFDAVDEHLAELSEEEIEELFSDDVFSSGRLAKVMDGELGLFEEPDDNISTADLSEPFQTKTFGFDAKDIPPPPPTK